MKQKALVMAEMQAFQNKRQEEDDILRNEIDDLLTAINKLESITINSSYKDFGYLLRKQQETIFPQWNTLDFYIFHEERPMSCLIVD